MTDTEREGFQRALEYFQKSVNVSGGNIFFSDSAYNAIVAALNYAIDDGTNLLAINQDQARIIGELRDEVRQLGDVINAMRGGE